MLQALSNILVTILTATMLIASISILMKDSHYLGNRLLALSLFLVAVWGLASILYLNIIDDVVVYILIRANYVLMFYSCCFLFFCMQVIVHSKEWFAQRSHTLPWLAGIGIYGIILFAVPETVVLRGYNPVDTRANLAVMLVLGVTIMYFMIFSMYAIYKHGIKRTEGQVKKKMKIAFAGFGILVASLFVNIASEVAREGQLLTVVFYAVITIGLVTIAWGFSRRKS